MNKIEERSAQLLAELRTAQRREVAITVDSCLHHTLDSLTLKAAIEKLKDLAGVYGEEARIDAETVYGEHDSGYKLRVVRYRKENDSEWMDRRSKELAEMDRRELAEREAYERLAKKFGNSGVKA